ILKEDYLGPLRSALNTSTPLFSRLEKNERDIAGKEAWIPIEMELNQGTGARGENEVLPVAGAGEYKELRVPLKHYYGVMSVTGPVMRQTEKGDRGSFGRIVDIEAKGIKKTLGLNLAHDFYAGDNLGLTTGATSGDATVELDSASRPYNMQWFRKGMRVDILDAGGAVVAGGSDLPITAVDKTAGTITVTGTPSDVAGGRVVRTGTAGKAMTSLEEIIDS
ncbi:MAG: hypothetical protein GTN93_34800, partial [Anaerolineae bacterium]|nr:hypothetical protein [Anaerolineae bacterium]